MTLLTVVQDVCGVVGVHRPASIFSGLASNRTAQEMLALANEMAQRIAYDEREWTKLIGFSIFTAGTGETLVLVNGQSVASSFTLPADYNRLLLNSNIWRSTSMILPMRFISSFDEWTQRRFWGYYDPRGEWTIQLGKIHVAPVLQPIFPDPANFTAWQNSFPYFVLGDYAKDTFDPANPTLWKVMVKHTSSPAPVQFWQERNLHPDYWQSVPITQAQTIHFNYLSKNCVSLASGGAGDRFMADNDTFVLPERLLKLGMIWQWKANKGSPYAEDMASYEAARDRAAGADKPSPIIVGNVNISTAARVAYPYPTPTSSDWSWPL